MLAFLVRKYFEQLFSSYSLALVKVQKKALLYKKHAGKMLVKLTIGFVFIDILMANQIIQIIRGILKIED